MSFSKNRLLPVAATLVAIGCGSSQAPAVDPLPAGPPLVQPGDGYVMYYADNTGIRLRNTGARVDSVLLSAATDVQAKPSPDRDAVALSFRRGGSAHLILVDAVTGAVSNVHSAMGSGSYTFAWARGGDALGAAFRSTDGSTQSAVLIADRAGNVRNVGCSVSNRFIAWRANGQIVIGDGANIYTVDARDCETLATLPMRGKTDITYSPDGSRVAFKRANSLFVAEYNGANTQQIAAARSAASNLQWSPDSRKIAFEIKSPRYANITHVAVYDYATGEATFRAEQRPLGVPDDHNPCWSPDGTRLSLDRSYARRGESGEYVQKQKVITPVPGEDENVVLEELIRGAIPASEGCAWVDDQHIAIVSADGPKILNVDTRAAYSMPDNVQLLFAKVGN